MEDGTFTYIYLFVVSLLGATTGAFNKWKKACVEKKENIPINSSFIIVNISTSLFIAYLVYEIAFSQTGQGKISLIIAGGAAFVGADFVEEFITDKFK